MPFCLYPQTNLTRYFHRGCQWQINTQGDWGNDLGCFLCCQLQSACASFWQLCDGLRRGAVPIQRPGVVGAAARREGEGAEHHHRRVRSSAGPAAPAGDPGCLLLQVLLPDMCWERVAEGPRCCHRRLTEENMCCPLAGGNRHHILAPLLLFCNGVCE